MKRLLKPTRQQRTAASIKRQTFISFCSSSCCFCCPSLCPAHDWLGCWLPGCTPPARRAHPPAHPAHAAAACRYIPGPRHAAYRPAQARGGPCEAAAPPQPGGHWNPGQWRLWRATGLLLSCAADHSHAGDSLAGARELSWPAPWLPQVILALCCGVCLASWPHPWARDFVVVVVVVVLSLHPSFLASSFLLSFFLFFVLYLDWFPFLLFSPLIYTLDCVLSFFASLFISLNSL